MFGKLKQSSAGMQEIRIERQTPVKYLDTLFGYDEARVEELRRKSPESPKKEEEKECLGATVEQVNTPEEKVLTDEYLQKLWAQFPEAVLLIKKLIKQKPL